MKYLIYLSVMFFEIAYGFAGWEEDSTGLDSIRRLSVGDSLPAELLEWPLVRFDGKKMSTNKLADFKGKVVILEFWATWCGPCIKSLPHLYELERQLKDEIVVLPITYEGQEEIKKLLSNEHSVERFLLREHLNTVVLDTVLRKHFPYRIIPHTVVIDSDGAVNAITSPELLTFDNLKAIISGEPLNTIPQKREKLEARLLKPTLASAKENQQTYYTAITGHFDGLLFSTDRYVDSVNNYHRYYKTSVPLVSLYNSAIMSENNDLATGLPIRVNRRILQTTNRMNLDSLIVRYGFSRNDADLDGNIQNKFNYEAILPANTSKRGLAKRMLADLDLFFDVKGRVREIEMECLVLDIESQTGDYRTLGDADGKIVLPPERIEHRDSLTKRYRTPMPLSSIIYYLNQEYFGAVPPVFLSEPLAEQSDVQLENFSPYLTTFAEVEQALGKVGIVCRKERRQIPMFILSDGTANFDIADSNLVLTQHGYLALPQ